MNRRSTRPPVALTILVDSISRTVLSARPSKSNQDRRAARREQQEPANRDESRDGQRKAQQQQQRRSPATGSGFSLKDKTAYEIELNRSAVERADSDSYPRG